MGKVADFEVNLNRNSPRRFAAWHAIDLHNHTPASEDYRYTEPDCATLVAGKIREKDLSVVMFTDHNKLPSGDFIKEVADKSQRLILRGTELNVFVDAWQKPPDKVDKNLFFHLLVGFDPSSSTPPEYWLEHIRLNCRWESRQSGDITLQGITSAIDELFDELAGSNALIVPAHLHSNRDAFKSRSIDNIYADPPFLRHAKEHFSALEVKTESTANYFDGHHTETEKLHKSCVRSSDSHHPDEIGTRPSYVQMQDVTFTELRSALTFPFRAALAVPPLPAAHIVGINIQGQFLNDLWLTFSPNCNAFIGVKGSGKTSLLECLRFVLGADVPKGKIGPVNDHLTAILGGSGKVAALIRRVDGAKVLVERSVADKGAFIVTFENDREERITRPDSLLFPAYILGWHEIEQAATDENIRRSHMDSIAGRDEVISLTEEARAICSTIRSQHDRAANAYSTYKQLEQQVARLKDLRKGLQELGPVLRHDKRSRQIMFTSHNANLVVLSDPELVATFESDGSHGWIAERGFAATPNSPITLHVIDILDGGKEALELRRRKYGLSSA